MTGLQSNFARLAPAEGTRLAVVGGCGGIGSALVATALAQGMQVVNLDMAQSIAKRPAMEGEWQIECDVGNVRKGSEIDAAFEQIAAKWGALDALVHLAGFMPSPVATNDTSDDIWDEVHAVNTRSAYRTMRAATPLLEKGNSASVVFTSSGLSATNDKNMGAYSISKAAINALTRNLAKELAPKIRVNAVAPGAVETAFLSGGTGRGGEQGSSSWFDEKRASIAANIPLRRVAVPDDVVGPMLFLLGDASRYMTGQILYVNGGKVML